MVRVLALRKPKLYAFDVDETLTVSQGPIPIARLKELRDQGQIVGISGNWRALVRRLPTWHKFVSFIGPPVGMHKDQFMMQLKEWIPAEEYVMVGNVKGVTGSSDDQGAAERAGFRFILEREFAKGKR